MRNVRLKILDKRIGSTFPVPEYATDGSAGLDLHACLPEPLELAPGMCRLIGSGIAIHLEDTGLMALIVPRSGLGHTRGLVMGNLTGVIDSDYQGEIKVSCWNRGKEPIMINPGDRIAQLLVTPVLRVHWQVVNDFNFESQRGTNGFGHTGVVSTKQNTSAGLPADRD